MTLSIWFPLPPGVSVLPPAPGVTTNPSPAPVNAVAAPTGFDPNGPNLATLFGTVLPTGVPPVWPQETTATMLLPGYRETVVEAVMVRPVAADRAVSYAFTLPTISETAIVRMVLATPTYVATAEAGVFALGGEDASLSIAGPLGLTAEAGAFALEGAAAGLSKPGNLQLTADAGGFSLTGQDAAMAQDRSLAPETGAFGANGQDAGLQKVLRLEADAGAIVTDGQDAALQPLNALTAAAGAFSLSGEDASLALSQVVLLPTAGAFSLIGQDATLTKNELDPYFSSVALLLHGNGADNGTTITDSSSANRTVTRVGAPVTSTTQSKFDGSSLYFDGSSYLTTSTIALTADFTIEVFFWATTITLSMALFGRSSGNVQLMRFNNNNVSGTLLSYNNATIFGGSTTDLAGTSSGQWYHIAMTRNGTVVKTFVNGNLRQTNDNYTATINLDQFGAGYLAGNKWNGYLDELRVTVGVSRYNATFTPPTSPFPNQ